MAVKRVVGLSVGEDGNAPVVVVKGANDAAEAILDRARSHHDLPVVSDSNLVDQLYRVPVDAAIGKELFPVIAALLIHVLHIDGRRKETER